MGTQMLIRLLSNVAMSPHILDPFPRCHQDMQTQPRTWRVSPNQWEASIVPLWPIRIQIWYLVFPPGYVQSPCGDTDPESRWSELCNYTQLPSQSETSVWGHWPMRAEHQEPAFRDQYTEPPTASVLGGVYLKSAPVRKWKDTDILIKIKTRFCFSSPLLWLRLSVSVLRCHHVGHTFPLTPRAQLIWTQNELQAWSQTVSREHRVADTPPRRGGDNWSLLLNKGPPSHHPRVIPGLQNKTETNKSNFRLDPSCLGLSTPTKSLSSSIWIQHCVVGTIKIV